MNTTEINAEFLQCYLVIVVGGGSHAQLSTKMKNEISLNSFKAQIKKWLPFNCPCRLCKSYINGAGILEGLN